MSESWNDSFNPLGIRILHPDFPPDQYYILTNSDQTYTTFVGSGFTYNDRGRPTGGTISEIRHVDVSGTVILERITSVDYDLGLLTAYIQPFQDLRDQITWTVPDQFAGPPAIFTDTLIRLANADASGAPDGTYTDIIGTGLLAGKNSPGAGIVTAVRHVAANGATLLDVPVANLHLDFLAAVLFISALASEVYHNVVVSGGVTHTVLDFPAPGPFGNVDTGISGGSGDDHFVGLASTAAGAPGSHITYEHSLTAVTVNLAAGTATGQGHDTFVNINAALGSRFADTLIGNAQGNFISGDAGDDTIKAAAGDDNLYGGEGNDTLNGGAGRDQANYYVYWDTASTAGATVDLRISGAQDTVSAGADTLISIENLRGSQFDDRLIGNGLANHLEGDQGNDILNGLGGNDELIGGRGDDIYGVDTNFDVVVEVRDQGVDKVISSAPHFVLPDNVEHLRLNGSANIDGSGNDLANMITGNSGDNRLFGLGGADALNGAGGNDELHGGYGRDRLTGGTGADSFVFDTELGVANRDVITDFSAGQDTIVLDSAVFTALAGTQLDADSFYVSGSGPRDAEDRVNYDKDTGGLAYDADGTGAQTAVVFAVLVGSPDALSFSDFVVI